MKVHPTHSTSAKPVCKWHYCRQCGLVYLHNDKTRKLIRQRCPDKDCGN